MVRRFFATPPLNVFNIILTMMIEDIDDPSNQYFSFCLADLKKGQKILMTFFEG